MKSIPRVFSNHTNDTPDIGVEMQLQQKPTVSETASSVSLEPEIKIAPGQHAWTSVDLVLTIDTVRLHLYDANASSELVLKEHGIALFALHNSALRLKLLSSGSLEAQVTLKSFTVSNTRPGNSKYREIIPAAQHNRNQFTILYTTAGDTPGSSLAVLTIDSPRIIFAVDPVIAVAEFFTSAFSETSYALSSEQDLSTESVYRTDTALESAFNYRVDLHDASISVIENDADSNSQAIELTIKQILLSQQARSVPVLCL